MPAAGWAGAAPFGRGTRARLLSWARCGAPARFAGPAGAPVSAGITVTTAHDRKQEAHGHHHRDVSGGWLRPAVFGAMDGLVTYVSLIAGVGGASVGSHFVILTGLAGLAAGACSMAAGEFVSVSSQNELAATFRARGVDAALALQVAAQISRNPDEALNVHVREELGVDPHDLPSPLV